jgi:hypothetical protein
MKAARPVENEGYPTRTAKNSQQVQVPRFFLNEQEGFMAPTE